MIEEIINRDIDTPVTRISFSDTACAMDSKGRLHSAFTTDSYIARVELGLLDAEPIIVVLPPGARRDGAVRWFDAVAQAAVAGHFDGARLIWMDS